MKVQARMVERPKVVLASPTPSVWHRAVLRFLDASPSLDFSILPFQRDACLAEIERLQPDWVVLLVERDSVDCSPTLAEVFSVAPRARVILICRWENNVRIHHCEQFELTRPEDLIDLITGETAREALPPATPSSRAKSAPYSAAGARHRAKLPHR